MHSMGLHSALAIKRQRKRRAEQKKAKERRYSVQSTESGLGGSRSSCGSPVDGAEHGPHGEHGPWRTWHHKKKPKKGQNADFESKVGIGMLQIGVVFVVIGVFLLGSSMIPNDFDNWKWQNIFTAAAWWNELVITGAFSMLLGIFLIILDKFISKKEEDDLTKYVEGQLTRSRSGHRLVRDVETGNLVTKRSKALTTINEDYCKDVNNEELPVVHSPKIKTPPANSQTGNHTFMNSETGAAMLSPQLEKILEEDGSVSVDDYRHVGSSVTFEEYDSTTASISPGSPSETQELLVGTSNHTPVSVPSKYHQVRMSKI